MRRLCFTLLLLCATATHAPAQNTHPDSAQFITDDIRHFWEAYDRAAPDFEPGPFQELYLDRGTVGLEGFIKGRIESADKLTRTIRARPGYYASIRESTLRILEMETHTRVGFYALKYLYPEAIFPPVYFVIGVMNSGGTTSDRAIIVGAEMYGLTPEAPPEELDAWLQTVLGPVESVPHLVAHELIHVQQRYPQGPQTLLSQSIKEGAADFLAELISGQHINEHVHDFANPQEEALWNEFQQRMHGTDYTGWLYSGSEGRPNDLGYWMGYKITAAYYERAADKHQAIKAILNIDDFDAFVAASGYAEKFNR